MLMFDIVGKERILASKMAKDKLSVHRVLSKVSENFIKYTFSKKAAFIFEKTGEHLQQFYKILTFAKKQFRTTTGRKSIYSSSSKLLGVQLPND